MKISGNIPAKERKKGNTNPYLKEGLIPSIIYGGNTDPVMVAVDTIQLKKRFDEGGFYSKIFEVEFGDKKEAVIVKSIQRHKVKHNPIHVDFQRVDEKTRIVISVPVEFTNQELSPGLKQGGILNVVRREIELSCLANNIPEKFVISLEGKEIGDVISTNEEIEVIGEINGRLIKAPHNLGAFIQNDKKNTHCNSIDTFSLWMSNSPRQNK